MLCPEKPNASPKKTSDKPSWREWESEIALDYGAEHVLLWLQGAYSDYICLCHWLLPDVWPCRYQSWRGGKERILLHVGRSSGDALIQIPVSGIGNDTSIQYRCWYRGWVLYSCKICYADTAAPIPVVLVCIWQFCYICVRTAVKLVKEKCCLNNVEKQNTVICIEYYS